MKPIVCLTLLALTAIAAPTAAATTSLREALTFHASFDHGPDADFAQGDRRLFTAPSMKHPRTGTPGLPTNGVVSIAAEVGQLFALQTGAATLHP